jgi:hypothetical protein
VVLPEGRAVLRDIDTFISGINDYLEETVVVLHHG